MHGKINEKKYIDFSFSYGTKEYIIKIKTLIRGIMVLTLIPEL